MILPKLADRDIKPENLLMDTAARVVTTSVAELRERNLAGFFAESIKKTKKDNVRMDKE